MRPLEDNLRSALRRRQAPAGFHQSVLSQIRTGEWEAMRNRRRSFFRRPAVRWLVTSLASLLLGIGFALYRREQRRQREARQAGRQAILALRITSSELNRVWERAQSVMARAAQAPTNLKGRRERQ
jgi:hypothetical protein